MDKCKICNTRKWFGKYDNGKCDDCNRLERKRKLSDDFIVDFQRLNTDNGSCTTNKNEDYYLPIGLSTSFMVSSSYMSSDDNSDSSNSHCNSNHDHSYSSHDSSSHSSHDSGSSYDSSSSDCSCDCGGCD